MGDRGKFLDPETGRKERVEFLRKFNEELVRLCKQNQLEIDDLQLDIDYPTRYNDYTMTFRWGV